MTEPVSQTTTSRVAAVRRFNRFYTRQIGALREGHLSSPFSLTEVRVLYELAHRETSTATDLAAALGLDPGYLSRTLQRFRQRRLITQKASPEDGRQRLLSLTALGRRTFEDLDARASQEIQQMLARLSMTDQQRVVEAMRTIEGRLGERDEPKVPYFLRPHRPGDLGWVVQRHGELYAEEYGWNEEFEALVARIAAQFIERLDPRRERCWIAEREGERVGCVFLAAKSKTAAQLRLLLVEPSARGLGIGKRLVEECDRFARQAGYRKITLWTQSVLGAARHIYEQAGYRLVSEKPHHSFGHDLVAEVWEKRL
ncbi:MAG TPA: bifunctional helix-turn-helix transcriptional regulator/GNAT family N-acetyltransferase [Thermoanaerobaculia bacterium]|jgi:DNA-binding MarR family transcriptional regulator/N-acetylglutamate synthase-like GNAT family acetyltransferase|nr:bifunctional helix-turn-helix transcriptional regulator/GNAT family N-acetyltransferase [Thermoanaerobaculia bacterium]